MERRFGPAPTAEEIEDLARAALARLPAPFAGHLGEIRLVVEDFADAETLADLGIADPFELTGLYSGVDLSRRSVFGLETSAPMVFLFRRPILDEWAEHGEVTLGELITHVLVHEIGHHFGLSDDDIHAIEAD